MNSPVLDSEKDLEILLLSYRSVLVCLIPTHSPCVLCALESRAAAVLSAVSALAFSKHILVLWRFLVLSVVHDNFYKYFYSQRIFQVTALGGLSQFSRYILSHAITH